MSVRRRLQSLLVLAFAMESRRRSVLSPSAPCRPLLSPPWRWPPCSRSSINTRRPPVLKSMKVSSMFVSVELSRLELSRFRAPRQASSTGSPGQYLTGREARGGTRCGEEKGSYGVSGESSTSHRSVHVYI
jgi:hypothetical protein